MLALWSRATQTRSSCRCRSCLNAATTIARRTTSAAGRRKSKFGDVFIVFYSSILASAAVADAKVKDHRRKEWDRLITEVKATIPGRKDEKEFETAAKAPDSLDHSHGSAGFDLQTPSQHNPTSINGQRNGAHIANRQNDPSPFSHMSGRGGRAEALPLPALPPKASETTTAASDFGSTKHKGLKSDVLFTQSGPTTSQLTSFKPMAIEDDLSFWPSQSNAFKAAAPAQECSRAIALGGESQELPQDKTCSKAPLVGTWDEIVRVGLPETNEGLDKTAMEPTSEHAEDLINWSEWLSDDDSQGLLLEREPQRPVHLERRAYAVEVMVTRLHSIIQARSSSLDSKGSLELANIQEQIGALVESSNHSLPSYVFEDVLNERLALHASLIKLYEKTAAGGPCVEVMVTKLCYNLLVSATPPSIITFNILLSIFNKLKEFDLGRVIVDTILWRIKLKPNPVTVRLMLEHFVATDDASGFREIIHRMNGTRGSLLVKRRKIRDLNRPSVKEWALSTKTIHRNRWLIQKFPRTDQVFATLISGSADLLNACSSQRFFRAALREGRTITSETLLYHIDACISRRDDRAGRRTLDAILTQWEGEDIPIGIDYCAMARGGIHKLLDFCGKLDWTLYKRQSVDSLRKLLNHMSMRALAEAIDHITKSIRELHAIVNDLDKGKSNLLQSSALAASSTGPGTPLSLRSQAAVHESSLYQHIRHFLLSPGDYSWILPPALRFSDDSNTNTARTLLYVLRTKIQSSARDIATLQQAVIDTSYAKLSQRSQIEFDTFCYQNAIPLRRSNTKTLLLSRLHAKDAGENMRSSLVQEPLTVKKEGSVPQLQKSAHRDTPADAFDSQPLSIRKPSHEDTSSFFADEHLSHNFYDNQKSAYAG